MSKRLRAALLLLFSLVLVACGGKPYVRDALEPGEVASDWRIGVLPINYLGKPAVEVFDNPVGLIGTAGKLAVIKGKDTKRRKFDEALRDAGYIYQEQLLQELMEDLAAAGLDARMLDFRRSIDNILEAVPPRRFEKRYPEAKDVDALLDLYVDFVGYAAPVLGDDYMPTFHVAVRLVDADSFAVLYDARIQYHAVESEGELTRLEAEPDQAFKDFDALMADIPRARDGLAHAVAAVVDSLVDQLARPGEP